MHGGLAVGDVIEKASGTIIFPIHVSYSCHHILYSCWELDFQLSLEYGSTEKLMVAEELIIMEEFGILLTRGRGFFVIVITPSLV